MREPRVARLTDITKAEAERLGEINTLFKMFDLKLEVRYHSYGDKGRGPKPFSLIKEGGFGWSADGFGRHTNTIKRFRSVKHVADHAAELIRRKQAQDSDDT